MTRELRAIVSLDLPLPPSVNKAFAARRGSHLLMKTAAYRFWLQQVREEHGAGRLLPAIGGGAYGLWIDLSPKMRGDIDNRTKLLSDVIKTPRSAKDYGLGVVHDDSAMAGVHLARLHGLAPDRCRITAVHMAAWADYVVLRMG